jgi:hypothetical protein
MALVPSGKVIPMPSKVSAGAVTWVAYHLYERASASDRAASYGLRGRGTP